MPLKFRIKTKIPQICLISGGFIAGIMGVIIILLGTSLYGIGISPDSVNYISCSKNIIAGNGMVTYTGDSFSGWPPLYPLILAAIGSTTGIDPIVSTKYLHAVVFGLIIVLSIRLFVLYVKSTAIIMFGIFFVLFSLPIVSISLMAWSEPIFILLLVIFLIYLQKFLDQGDLRTLILISFVTALSCLQRYVGITLIATGVTAIVLLMPTREVLKKIKYSTIFFIISTTPLILWFLRNFLISNALTGSRSPAKLSFQHYISVTFDVLSSWFMPLSLPYFIRILFVIVFCFIFIGVSINLYTMNNNVMNIKSVRINSLSFFIIIYISFLIISSSITKLDPIPYRYLSVVYIPVICLFLVGIENTSLWLNRRLKSKLFGNLVVILFSVIWITYPIKSVINYTQARISDGTGFYTSTRWKTSSLVRWLNANSIDGIIYSNAPDAIYILNEINAKWLSYNAIMKNNKSSNNIYIVWFNSVSWRSFDKRFQEVKNKFNLEIERKFPDGVIYKVR